MSDQFKNKRVRFPAYDDEQGVKLNTEKKRDFFGDDVDFLTDYRLDEKTVFEREIQRPNHNRRRRLNLEEEPKRDLERHKAKLPDYTPVSAEPRRSRKLFQEEPKPKIEKKAVTLRSTEPVNTRFKPTYVPASLIPDEPADAIATRDLYNSMAKPSASYLLFEEQQQLNLKKNHTNQRLDRSLRGILQEGSNDALDESKYFKE